MYKFCKLCWHDLEVVTYYRGKMRVSWRVRDTRLCQNKTHWKLTGKFRAVSWHHVATLVTRGVARRLWRESSQARHMDARVESETIRVKAYVFVRFHKKFTQFRQQQHLSALCAESESNVMSIFRQSGLLYAAVCTCIDWLGSARADSCASLTRLDSP